MTFLYFLLFLAQSLTSATDKVYTGFCHGAFWSTELNCKFEKDFEASFNYGKNLSTPVPFDSARLFTSIQCNTKDDYTQAFDAAMKTNTNLLLGFWAKEIKPDARKNWTEDPNNKDHPPPLTNAEMLDNELSALEKGFKKYGQKLADLVIGLSVGNEDIYDWKNGNGSQYGLAEEIVKDNIKFVRDKISKSPFSEYMKGKPIGHTDTATWAGDINDDVDFIGMNAYPYWNKDPPERANESFYNSIADTQRRGNGVDVWLTEIGWPYQDNVSDVSWQNTATVANMQKYWTETGCSVIGKYNTFWFQLLKDTDENKKQPEFSIMDARNHSPRIDLSCPGNSSIGIPPGETPLSSEAAAPAPAPSSTNLPSTFVTSPSDTASPQPPTPPPSSSASENSIIPPPSLPPIQATSPASPSSTPPTVTVYTTVIVTIPPDATPAGAAGSTAPPPVQRATSCVTVADVSGNGQLSPIATNPTASWGGCPSPDAYTAATSAAVVQYADARAVGRMRKGRAHVHAHKRARSEQSTQSTQSTQNPQSTESPPSTTRCAGANSGPGYCRD